jgi:quercetin dioxygenase-like cupin family protein
MVALRLQGHETSDTSAFWAGLSHFLPGGGAEASGSALERLYVVVAGEITVIADEDEQVLGPLDSVWFARGEVREVVNRSTLPASMLVVMPYPTPTAEEG